MIQWGVNKIGGINIIQSNFWNVIVLKKMKYVFLWTLSKLEPQLKMDSLLWLYE